MSEIVCDSCGNQRNELNSVPSQLMNSMTFNLCRNCRDNGMEPRWLIVLVARGGRDVSEWVNNKRYHGEDISPDDIPSWYFPHLS